MTDDKYTLSSMIDASDLPETGFGDKARLSGKQNKE